MFSANIGVSAGGKKSGGGSTYYPPVGFHFSVDFPGVGAGDKDARFQEVTGLTSELTVEDLPAGGENRFSYRLPSRAKYSNLVLKRGMLNDSGLINWIRNAIENFEFRPVDVNVHLLNENHEVLTAWKIIQAYPVKWIISNFDAKGNSLVIETIELAYQYFQRQVDNMLNLNFSAGSGLNTGVSASLNASAGLSAGLNVSAGISANVDVSAGISGGIGF